VSAVSDAPELPGRKSPPARTAWSLLRRFWEFARPHRRWVFLGLFMIPLVAGLTTLRPLLLRHAVDVNIPEGDALGLRLMGIAFLGAVVAEFLCQAVQIYALQRAGHGTISDVRRIVFEHVLRLPNRFFDRHAIGSLLTRTTSDVEAVSETLSFGVFTIVTDIVMIGAILTAMFWLNAWLAAIALALAPVLVILVQTFGRALRRLQLEVRKARAAQDGYLAEQLTGITVVQLFHREDAAHREYERRGQRYLRATKWANVYDALLFSVMDGVAAFAIALMIWFAAPDVLVGDGVLTLGLLFAFIDYLQRIFEPIKQFSSKLATIQRAAASLERIYGLLDEPTETRSLPAPDPMSPVDPLEGWRGGVRVRDLSFSYKEDGPDVLRDVSFDIAPGEVVAVVGRTGSGKTTLGRLITRFYEGYRGSIELDLPSGSRELSTVPPDALRRHALLVQQDVFLFSDDVAFNVSLGDPALRDDPERLERALEVVQADRLVQRRGGLDFEVGERGRNLSAGEAQLLAFARVAARAPTLLILDEATANVDSVTEQKVQAAIERLLQGRSVLVIAHRLSTVRRADKILVMSAGRIVEQGNHDQLIARGGVYAELYRMGFEEPPTDDE
jgi:ATP-binding cassette, subfamily B, multidrug efflux pump